MEAFGLCTDFQGRSASLGVQKWYIPFNTSGPNYHRTMKTSRHRYLSIAISHQLRFSPSSLFLYQKLFRSQYRNTHGALKTLIVLENKTASQIIFMKWLVLE